MALNDTYEMTLDTLVFGEVYNNVFYYLGGSANSTAQGLCEAWDAFNGANWADALSDVGELIAIRAKNLDDLADIGSIVISRVGQRGGERLANFMCVTLELGAVSPLIFAGRKAISPVSEIDVAGGSVTGGYQPVIDQVAADMLSTITDVGANDYLPAMYSPANQTHAFDITSSLATSVFKRVSTQNSRKPF